MKTLFRMRAINRTQQGITLIELIIAIAIAGLIGSVVVTGVYQIFKINATEHQSPNCYFTSTKCNKQYQP